MVDELYKMQKYVSKNYEEKQFIEKAYLAQSFKVVRGNKKFLVLPKEVQELGKVFYVELARQRENRAKEVNMNLELLFKEGEMSLITQ